MYIKVERQVELRASGSKKRSRRSDGLQSLIQILRVGLGMKAYCSYFADSRPINSAHKRWYSVELQPGFGVTRLGRSGVRGQGVDRVREIGATLARWRGSRLMTQVRGVALVAALAWDDLWG